MKTTTPQKSTKTKGRRGAIGRTQILASSEGIKIIIGEDTWHLVEGVDDLFAIGNDDMSFGDNPERDELVIVDPGARRIVTGTCFNHAAFGTAILHAIAISTDSL